MRRRHIYTPPPKPPVDPVLLSPMVQIGQVLIEHKHWPEYKPMRCVVYANRGEETAKRERKKPSPGVVPMGLREHEYDVWEVILDDLSTSYYVSREEPRSTYRDWRKDWTITEEIAPQSEIDKLLTARAEMLADEHRQKLAELRAYHRSLEGDFEELVAKLRAENPWATSTETDSRERAAINLQAELKQKYPKTRFTFSGLKKSYRDIRVRWYLPGPSLDEFRELLQKYKNPHGGRADRYERDGVMIECGYDEADRRNLEEGKYWRWWDRQIIWAESPTGRAYETVFGLNHDIRPDPHDGTREEVKARSIEYWQEHIEWLKTEMENGVNADSYREGIAKAEQNLQRLKKGKGKEAAQ